MSTVTKRNRYLLMRAQILLAEAAALIASATAAPPADDVPRLHEISASRAMTNAVLTIKSVGHGLERFTRTTASPRKD